MTTADLKQRLEALERKVEDLSAGKLPAANKEWLLKVWGSFANDPDFEQAMKYGRQWRGSENRKSLAGKKPSSAAARKRRK